MTSKVGQWNFVSGDLDWLDYGSTYARYTDKKNYVELAEFINLHEHDESFNDKYLLKVYKMSVSDIINHDYLKSATEYTGMEDLEFKDGKLCMSIIDYEQIFYMLYALVSYSGLSGYSDDYYGNNAYKLFSQAGIKPFN